MEETVDVALERLAWAEGCRCGKQGRMQEKVDAFKAIDISAQSILPAAQVVRHAKARAETVSRRPLDELLYRRSERMAPYF